MRLAVLAGAVALALAFATPPAAAHAFLDHAVPAVGSTVQAAPAEVRLWFTEALEPAFSTIAVTAADGRHVEHGKAQLDPADHAILVVPLAALPPGTYRVSWRVVSVDTHPTQGEFAFTVAP